MRLAGAAREAHPEGSSRAKRQYRADEALRRAGKGAQQWDTQFQFLVGIDWASEEHVVSILNQKRELIEERKIKHTGAGLNELVERLLEISGGDPSRVAVGIETPRGAVVELLVERGFAVFSLNPKQMDRFRDRHSVAGAKDDSRDSFVIGDALATDLHKFHRIQLDDPFIIRLRELSRTEEDLKQNQVRTCNQLRDLLNRYFPEMLGLCPSVNEPWFWELLEKAPVAQQAAKLSAARIQKVLKAHRIRRITGAEVREALQSQPLQLAPGAAEAASEHVLLLLPQLRLTQQQLTEIGKRMESLLTEMSAEGQITEHRDINILLSLPGVGQCVAATMLAEASQALAERDYHALRSYAGIAPVTRQSGKRSKTLMRQSCNERLRNAIYHWSRVSAQHDVRSKEHYTLLRAKGHSHGRALRGVGDRLLAVLVAMLRTGTEYDPTRRAAASHPPAQ